VARRLRRARFGSCRSGRDGIPYAGCSCLSGVCGEVLRRTSERPLDAVGQVRVAAIQHRREQVVGHPEDIFRRAGGPGPLYKGVVRHLHVLDPSPCRLGELSGHVRKRKEPRAGDFVHVTRMAWLGQRGHSDVGDVIDVDEGFGRIARGVDDSAGLTVRRASWLGRAQARPQGVRRLMLWCGFGPGGIVPGGAVRDVQLLADLVARDTTFNWQIFSCFCPGMNDGSPCVLSFLVPCIPDLKRSVMSEESNCARLAGKPKPDLPPRSSTGKKERVGAEEW